MSNVQQFPQTRETTNRLAERLLEQARRDDKKVVYRRFGNARPCGRNDDGPEAA